MALLTDIASLMVGSKAYLCLSISLLYVLIASAQTIYTWYKLRHFKGPFWAGFSKVWMVHHLLVGNTFQLDTYEACKKYGPITRIGPEQLITSDANVVKRYLAARSPYVRSDWYVGMRFDPDRDNIESTRDEERHAWLRSRMAAGYSGKENESLEKTIDQIVSAFMDLLSSKYLSTSSECRPVDFGRKVQYFTIDAITALAHGRPFGCLSSDSDKHDYIKTVETMVPVAGMITVYPWLNWVLQTRLVKPFLPTEADPIGVGKVKAITKEIVAERFGPEKKEVRDMMGSFIRHGLSQDEVESETIVQLIAGSDTTATVIRSTFLYLLSSPRILSKLRAELSSATISSPIITDAEARKIPYLQAVLKEGLRIWPPIAALLSKEVPPGGDVLNGIFVPAGTRIGWCPWGLFRNKKTFGEDADAFRPERWLNGEPEAIKEMEDTIGLVFSYGKHGCLGKNVAMMELNKVLVELFRRFDFALVDPSKPWDCKCIGIFQQKQMWVTITEREAA